MLKKWVVSNYPVLTNRLFVIFLTGRTISAVGNSFSVLALSLYLYDLTGNIASLSLMFIVRTLSRLLLQPYFGVLVDRTDRYKLLLIAQFLNAVVAFAFVFVTEGSLLTFYILIFLLQSLDGILGPAQGAVTPQIVTSEEIVSANTVSSISSKIALTLGAALGALLYAQFSAQLLFSLNSLSFLIALCTIIPLRGKIQPLPKRKSHWISDFKSGLATLKEFPVVIHVFVLLFTNSLVWRLFEILIVPISGETEMGSTGLGFLYSSLTIGGIIGAFLTPMIAKKIPKVSLGLNLSFLLTAIPFVIFGITENAFLYILAMLMSGVLLDILGIYSTSTLQIYVPNESLGRVLAFQNVAIALGAVPTLLSLEPLTSLIGYHPPFLLCAGLIIGVAVYFSIQGSSLTKANSVVAVKKENV